jgi:hypothetical protein
MSRTTADGRESGVYEYVYEYVAGGVGRWEQRALDALPLQVHHHVRRTQRGRAAARRQGHQSTADQFEVRPQTLAFKLSSIISA